MELESYRRRAHGLREQAIDAQQAGDLDGAAAMLDDAHALLERAGIELEDEQRAVHRLVLQVQARQADIHSLRDRLKAEKRGVARSGAA